jgi:hypothetical protein
MIVEMKGKRSLCLSVRNADGMLKQIKKLSWGWMGWRMNQMRIVADVAQLKCYLRDFSNRAAHLCRETIIGKIIAG